MAGYVLNFSGVESNDTLSHLADIGIELLLFTVGLKLKLSSLLRREVLSVGTLHLLVVTLVSALVYFGFNGQDYRRLSDRRELGFFQYSSRD
jgi:Sodium/hydrogen exchanger family.